MMKTGNVPGGQIGFQPLKHLPSVHVGQADIERNRGRHELTREGQRRLTTRCHDYLELLRMGQIQEPLREVEIIFNDQD